ncbi:hypothetical protein NXX19_25940 [Bacteroides ovatus]|nr:hypothetical protein [Bacteroides ovatus]
MKKLSILFISSLIGTAGLMTSCSEDYPGTTPGGRNSELLE